MYQITTKPYVDKVFAYSVGPPVADIGEMLPQDAYDAMEMSSESTKTFAIKLPPNTKEIIVNMLGYGVGGTHEYSINNLVSIPIDLNINKDYKSIIVVNTPTQMRYCILEFPEDIRNLLGVDKYLHTMLLDTKGMKQQHNYTNEDLLARGMDPVGACWVTHLEPQFPEWALNRPDELLRVVNMSNDVIVHCFSLHKTQKIELNKVYQNKISQ